MLKKTKELLKGSIAPKFVQRTVQFGKDKSGSVAVYAAVVVTPLLGLMGGGAVDLVRHANMQNRLQSAMESGVLAAASLNNSRPTIDIVHDYACANFPEIPCQELKNAIKLDTNQRSLTSRKVKITAEYDVPTSFLGLFGVDKLQAKVSSEAIQSREEIEIALVLDISSSMSGQKIKNLKTATKQFIDSVTNNGQNKFVSINLVPYGGTVNIKPIFDAYAVPTSSAINNPNKSQYDIGKKVRDKKFRFSSNRKCLELRFDDFSGELLDEKKHPQLPEFAVWNSKNPWCPKDSTAVMFNTNDFEELKKRVDAMELSDGTGSDVGVAWGAKTLSPKWRGKLGGVFPNRPADYDSPTAIKVAVVMTDGGITKQYRPRDPNKKVPNNWKKNRGVLYEWGGHNSKTTDDNAGGNFVRACEALTGNNVAVYTIGFKLKKDSGADKLLRRCASAPGNHFFVESLDIAKAFQAISAAISGLRISG